MIPLPVASPVVTEPIDLRPAAARFVALAAGTADGELTGATPCTAYDVGDLIDHVALVAEGSRALAHDDLAAVAATRSASGRSHLGPAWRDDLAALLGDLGEAWAEPGAWEGPGVPGSGLGRATWGRIALTELVVHGWDLAVATGQPFGLDDAPTLDACWAHVAAFVPVAPVPQLWGPAVAVPDDAPAIDRIVAVTGRDPGWAPPT